MGEKPPELMGQKREVIRKVVSKLGNRVNNRVQSRVYSRVGSRVDERVDSRVARRIDSRVVSKVGSKVYFRTLRLRDTHGILGHRLITIVIIPSNCPPKYDPQSPVFSVA